MLRSDREEKLAAYKRMKREAATQAEIRDEDKFTMNQDDELGAGGSAFVCRGRLGRFRVACKVIEFKGGKQQKEKTEKDARAEFAQLDRCAHPNVVHVFGVYWGNPNAMVIVMEELKESVRQRIDRTHKPLSLATQLDVLVSVLTGLQHIHSRFGVFHRDIKGENVMWAEGGAVKMVDFGIAKTTDDAATQSIEGTLPFMAPGALAGEEFSAQTDLYSLAIAVRTFRGQPGPSHPIPHLHGRAGESTGQRNGHDGAGDDAALWTRPRREQQPV